MWLVLGNRGQLGRCLGDVLAHHGIEHTGVDSRECDITDQDAVMSVVHLHRPTVVANAAAWTAVDDAEDHESRALLVNGAGARHCARAAKSVRARFIHISTDYVFSGRSGSPYAVTAPPDPINAYGRTKLAGERAVAEEGLDNWYVLRTAWLYSQYGKNFAKTMVSRAVGSNPVRVVDDQRGQPTSALDLARLMVELCRANAPSGIFHATNAGEATWFEFARSLYEAVGADTALVSPTDSSAYPTKAARPVYSVLDHSAFAPIGVPPMRHWREALQEVVGDIAEQVRLELRG